MDTKDLIRSCKERDETAFRKLVDSHMDFAFSVAYRILNDEDEARDTVQESFISVWQKIESFNTGRSFSNWLYRIIVNRCYDALRKRKRTINHTRLDNLNISGIISDSNPEEKLGNEEIGRLIRLMTGRLSPGQKVVFVLSELEGLNHDEISEITGMAKTSVKSNLNHARKKIRTLIEIYI